LPPDGATTAPFPLLVAQLVRLKVKNDLLKAFLIFLQYLVDDLPASYQYMHQLLLNFSLPV